jgi:hypothetical protein
MRKLRHSGAVFVAAVEGNHKQDVPATKVRQWRIFWDSTVAATVANVTPMMQPVEDTRP